NSLLILPAASARNVAGNMRQYHIVSIFIAVVSGIAGLILSYYWGTATGATIVLCAAAFFLVSFLFRFKNA
ncbi:MAG: metal ABC transporter permease, partial [Syntrophomonas sp.]